MSSLKSSYWDMTWMISSEYIAPASNTKDKNKTCKVERRAGWKIRILKSWRVQRGKYGCQYVENILYACMRLLEIK